MFAIDQLQYRTTPKEYIQTHKGATLAQRVASIALDVYISDMKALVTDGLTKELKRAEEGFDNDDDEDETTQENSKLRSKMLKRWLKLEYPFDYGESNSTLALIVQKNKASAKNGLPLSTIKKISVVEFVEKIFDLAISDRRHSNKAPLVPGGNFLSVLRIALNQMRKCSTNTTSTPDDAWVKYHLKEIVIRKRIRYIPWHPDSQQGRSSQKAVWNVWMNLGLPNATLVTNPKPVVAEEDILQSQSQDSQQDPNVPWLLESFLFQDLDNYLDRQVKPSEWTRECNPTSYVEETLTWAYDTYNPQNMAHKLAVVVAAIFIRMLPNVGFGPEHLAMKNQFTSRAATTKAIQESPWVYPGRVAGLSNKAPFVPLIISFILALLDPKSPLRVRMKQQNGGFGTPWTKKFGLLPELIYDNIDLTHNTTGIKCITGVNLIRLGVAWGDGPKAIRSGIYGRDWELFSEKELKQRFKVFREIFKQGPTGPYDAVRMLCGSNTADVLAYLGECHGTPGIYKAPTHLTTIEQARRAKKRTFNDDDQVASS